MESNTLKEINTLKQMARNWARGYKTWIVPGDDNDYVYQEFLDEIHTHLAPYVNRLLKMEYLTPGEAEDIIKYFVEQMLELREYADQA